MYEITHVIDYDEEIEKKKQERLKKEIENLKLVKEHCQKTVDVFIFLRESMLELDKLFSDYFSVNFDLGNTFDKNKFRDRILQINKKLLIAADYQDEVEDLFKNVIKNNKF